MRTVFGVKAVSDVRRSLLRDRVLLASSRRQASTSHPFAQHILLRASRFHVGHNQFFRLASLHTSCISLDESPYVLATRSLSTTANWRSRSIWRRALLQRKDWLQAATPPAPTEGVERVGADHHGWRRNSTMSMVVGPRYGL